MSKQREFVRQKHDPSFSKPPDVGTAVSPQETAAQPDRFGPVSDVVAETLLVERRDLLVAHVGVQRNPRDAGERHVAGEENVVGEGTCDGGKG